MTVVSYKIYSMNFIRRKNITFREYLKKFGYTKKMVSRIIVPSADLLNEGLRKGSS